MIIRLIGIYEAFGDSIFQFGSSDPHPRGCRDPEWYLALPVRWVPRLPGDPPSCTAVLSGWESAQKFPVVSKVF